MNENKIAFYSELLFYYESRLKGVQIARALGVASSILSHRNSDHFMDGSEN
jgi:hypothetical protein